MTQHMNPFSNQFMSSQSKNQSLKGFNFMAELKQLSTKPNEKILSLTNVLKTEPTPQTNLRLAFIECGGVIKICQLLEIGMEKRNKTLISNIVNLLVSSHLPLDSKILNSSSLFKLCLKLKSKYSALISSKFKNKFTKYFDSLKHVITKKNTSTSPQNIDSSLKRKVSFPSESKISEIMIYSTQDAPRNLRFRHKESIGKKRTLSQMQTSQIIVDSLFKETVEWCTPQRLNEKELPSYWNKFGNQSKEIDRINERLKKNPLQNNDDTITITNTVNKPKKETTPTIELNYNKKVTQNNNSQTQSNNLVFSNFPLKVNLDNSNISIMSDSAETESDMNSSNNVSLMDQHILTNNNNNKTTNININDNTFNNNMYMPPKKKQKLNNNTNNDTNNDFDFDFDFDFDLPIPETETPNKSNTKPQININDTRFNNTFNHNNNNNLGPLPINNQHMSHNGYKAVPQRINHIHNEFQPNHSYNRGHGGGYRGHGHGYQRGRGGRGSRGGRGGRGRANRRGRGRIRGRGGMYNKQRNNVNMNNNRAKRIDTRLFNHNNNNNMNRNVNFDIPRDSRRQPNRFRNNNSNQRFNHEFSPNNRNHYRNQFHSSNNFNFQHNNHNNNNNNNGFHGQPQVFTTN